MRVQLSLSEMTSSILAKKSAVYKFRVGICRTFGEGRKKKKLSSSLYMRTFENAGCARDGMGWDGIERVEWRK